MYESGKIILCRLPHGGDLLEEITELARREGIKTGMVTAIGAVKRARQNSSIAINRQPPVNT